MTKKKPLELQINENWLRQVEADLGVTSGFFSAITDSDDWSCVVRAATVLEASLYHQLCEKLPEISDVLENLSVCGQSGKLSLAKALGVCGPAHESFIKSICSLRNRLVHKLQHANFDFKEYIGELPKKEAESLLLDIAMPFMAATVPPARIRRKKWLALTKKMLPQDLKEALVKVVGFVPKEFIKAGLVLIASEAYGSMLSPDAVEAQRRVTSSFHIDPASKN